MRTIWGHVKKKCNQFQNLVPEVCELTECWKLLQPWTNNVMRRTTRTHIISATATATMKTFSGVNCLDQAAPSSLLHRLGGPCAVETTVDLFYDKVVQDSFLMPFFERTNLADLKVHQKHFFLLAFTNLLPTEHDYHQVHSYLIKHHQRLFQMGLNETHFDRVAGHLVVSLHELQVTSSLIDDVVAILLPLRPAFQEGARKYGHDESKEDNWSDRMEDDDELHDVGEADDHRRMVTVQQVAGILADFSCRVSSDPQLVAFWNAMDGIETVQQHHFIESVLLDSSTSVEVAQQWLEQQYQQGNLGSWDDKYVDIVANHFVAALESATVFGQKITLKKHALAVVSSLRDVFVDFGKNRMIPEIENSA